MNDLETLESVINSCGLNMMVAWKPFILLPTNFIESFADATKNFLPRKGDKTEIR